MKKSSAQILVVAVLIFGTTACSSGKKAASGSSTSGYCNAVKTAMAKQPKSGALDRSKWSTYAQTLDSVVQQSPASDKTFWTALDAQAKDIGNGGNGGAGSTTALGQLFTVAQRVRSQCNVDIAKGLEN